jgi:hypothetical protein
MAWQDVWMETAQGRPSRTRTHLLHLAFTLTPNLAHLETDQLPQRIHIRGESLPYLPDHLASLRAGHGADEAGGLLCSRDGLAGFVDCPLEDNMSDPDAVLRL